MRALIQRVSEARVAVSGAVVGEIGPGLLILVCAMRDDPDDVHERLARRVVRLRIFRDEEGRMNRSLLDTGGAALIVSQFTLAADTRSGNRPDFSTAAPPDRGEALYLRFAEAIAREGVPVATGRFGATMQVSLVNDGPVTIWMES
ncbi:D-aminoacyl-tRNA deacylase [Roseitranquillus sediminis]|uniref:D-aminoacyl-tRNA deacylase n=1 Tax=Roseitranquillus sediminis TaxID=2809051 RepID=UPI001D0CCC4E|nr:D-aminoacyl-tRNA deacylase [Roseitranquillus sediminis]MBM9594788.1 D-tyrosyl-tRNA(Tyr) deacylase [Roseitranquillus sediminis]